MSCQFIDLCALPPEAQAAWAQAILSVVAIIAAAQFPRWQQQAERRSRIDAYVEMLSLATSEAESVVDHVVMSKGMSITSNVQKEWTRFLNTLQAVPLHDVPHPSLFSIIQDAARACEAMKSLYDEELLRQSNIVTDRHIGLIKTEALVLQQCYEDSAEISNRLAGLNLQGRSRWTWYRVKSWIKKWQQAKA